MPEENNGGQESAQPLFGGTDSQGKERLFTDAQDAAKSWQASQDHIKSLESKSQDYEATINSLKQQLEEQASTNDKVDQALELLKQKEGMMQTTDNTETVDIEALKVELVKQAQEAANNSVTNFERQKIASNNQEESIEAARKYFGDEFESKLREIGSGLGLDDGAIKTMAASNPALFKQTFGLSGKAGGNPNPDGSVNTSLFGTTPPEIKAVNKHWGTSSKAEALNHNVATVEKMLKQSGGDIEAVKTALGITGTLHN